MTDPGARAAPDRRRLAAALVVLWLVVFSAAAAGTWVRATRGAQTTADEPQYLLTALSLAETGSLDIADELADERWRDFHEVELPEQTRRLPDGRRVSPHDPALPLLLAPAVAAGGWVGAKLALAALAGFAAVATALVAVVRFGATPWVAIAVAGAFGASAPLSVYGTQVYPELPAALVVLGGVAALTGPLRRPGRWALVAAVVALPWLAVKYAPVAAVLAVAGLVRVWRAGRQREAIGMMLTLVGAAVAFAGIHLAVYTGVTAYAAGDHFVDGELTAVGFAPDYLGRSRRLLGLLVDRRFGLAAWQPAWLAAIPAVTGIVRRRPPGWDALVAPAVAGWLTATFVALTMHGYWFPGRQVVVVAPLLVVAIAVEASRVRLLRIAVVAAAVLGVASYAWLLADGATERITWVVDFWQVRDPWYRLWSAALPDYLEGTAGTWVRHGVWLVVGAALAAAGWRLGRAGARGAHR